VPRARHIRLIGRHGTRWQTRDAMPQKPTRGTPIAARRLPRGAGGDGLELVFRGAAQHPTGDGDEKPRNATSIFDGQITQLSLARSTGDDQPRVLSHAGNSERELPDGQIRLKEALAPHSNSNDDDAHSTLTSSQLSKPSCRLQTGNSTPKRTIPVSAAAALQVVYTRTESHTHAQLHRTFTNHAPSVTFQELDHRSPWPLQLCSSLSCLTNRSVPLSNERLPEVARGERNVQ
jgi:hypothetical protein